MRRQHPRQGEPRAERTREIYEFLLHETGEVARQSVNRLRALHERFPSAFGREHLAYLQELCSPSPGESAAGWQAERRMSPRFPKEGTRLSMAETGGGTDVHQGQLLDR